MKDVNKDKRRTMWICFITFVISIPAFKLFDRQNLDEDDFITISNVVLSGDSKYDPGGGKGSTRSMELHFEGTKRFFRLVYDEYQCINNINILSNFKKGDNDHLKSEFFVSSNKQTKRLI